MRAIRIPQPNNNDEFNLDVEKNLIIVGANGSGKSRFGSRIETSNNPTKRISAQRYLSIEEVVPRLDYQTADSQLRNEYKNKPPILPQNDFQKVLVSLFAEEIERDSNYVAASRETETKPPIPKSIKEKVVEVWNFIFPYITIKLERDRARAADASEEFSATEMSDGEKVGLYLICQILLAEKDCILIIDEPELHLHKSLMVRLWNKLEQLRNDCVFIYVTHDLDFAVSKPANKVIWVKKYKESLWDWVEVDPNEIIPDNLFLEVIGSRKPILFVEGEKGSLDIQLYQSYYENFTVLPRGSCEKVIESVKGLKGNHQLHDKEVFGLIDRDFRPLEQLRSLEDDKIFSICLNKVENIFLIPEIIDIICDHLGKKASKEDFINAIRNIYDSDKDQIAFAASKFKMQRILNESFGSIKSATDYDQFKKDIFDKLDAEIVAFTPPPKEADLKEILEVYPHKGLVRRVQVKLDLTKDGYRNLVLSFLSSEKRKQVLDALKHYLPDIK